MPKEALRDALASLHTELGTADKLDAESRALLTFAFVRELLERITDDPTRKRAQDEMAARLPDGTGLLELFQEES